MFWSMMFLNIIRTIICIFSVQVVAFINTGNGQEALEMIEQGRNQYQLLEERGKLPKYGECWQSAIEHIQEGCRQLSEETQSDIALHITNCFLAMSGHEVYKCELDKKPNLRGICINSMSDRAFNVYTEFYTHTQNMCWFLRGQIWQEKITENTMQVGKQLKNSLSQQEILLKQQQQSLEIQEKLLNYGLSLERVLNESRLQAAAAMHEIHISTIKHQELLTVMADSLGGLKSWLIGEISWFDSLVWYLGTALIIAVVTSTPRSAAARLPLLIMLSLNVAIERAICSRLNAVTDISDARLIQEDIHWYVWWCRRVTTFICSLILLVLMYTYRDYAVINNTLLLKIHEQNKLIHGVLGTHRVSVEKEINGVDSTTPSVQRYRPQITPITSHTTKYNLRSRTPVNQKSIDLTRTNNSHV